jgi:hypothetical protein
MRCEGHLTLPHVDEPNEWSDAGNKAHAEDEDAINSGDVPEDYTGRWPGLTWRSEVSYAYDVATDTARFLGVGIKRAYGDLSPFEIPGTIDAEGRGPGILVVIDKKSFEAVTPAKENPQVRFLALAAARAEPAQQIITAISHKLTGLDVSEIDSDLDLDGIAYDARKLQLDVADVLDRARRELPVKFETGRWCRWCPAYHACPKQAELKALATLPEHEIALKAYLDEESAPEVYALYLKIKILKARIGQQLQNYVLSRPIPLGNGKMYGARNKVGNTKLDGEIVHAAISDLYSTELADKAVIRTATKKAIGEALKGKRGAVPEVLREIEKRGGVTRGTKIVFEEYQVGPALLTDGDE